MSPKPSRFQDKGHGWDIPTWSGNVLQEVENGKYSRATWENSVFPPLLHHQPLSWKTGFSFTVHAFSKLTITNLKAFVVFTFLWGFFCVYVFHGYFKYCRGHTVKDIAFMYWSLQGYGLTGGHKSLGTDLWRMHLASYLVLALFTSCPA